MKKYFSILVAVLLAAVGFVSCGDDESDAPAIVSVKFAEPTNVDTTSVTLNATYTGTITAAEFRIAAPGKLDYTWKIVGAQFTNGKISADVTGLTADESYSYIVAVTTAKGDTVTTSTINSFSTAKPTYNADDLVGKWILTNGRGTKIVNYDAIKKGTKTWADYANQDIYGMEVVKTADKTFTMKYSKIVNGEWQASYGSGDCTFDGQDISFTTTHPEPFETVYVKLTYFEGDQLHLEKDARDLGGGNTSTYNEYYRRW